jgi:7,8-dihydropterin-6-yl-methyl-4-(beta-D-ribofuranosyl)aminobenzene 5'-phosphate synthase
MIFFYIIVALIALVCLFLAIKLKQLKAGNKKAAADRASLKIEPLTDIGSVSSFSLLPLVDFYTDDDRLKTEPGVSYLIKADDTTLLMDVGFNKKKAHPSPLVHNMQALGVTLENLDYLFFSHLHLDHVGGMQAQKSGQFSLSQGSVSLPAIPAYAPTEMAPSHWNPGPEVKVIKNPQVLSKGVASIGVIPRNLFLMGYTLENSLAVNIAGKGIVLVIGCGHQTIERIIKRAQQLFDDPIYGIIGGLHFPVKDGRIMIGPLNLQNIVGADTPPWKGIGEQDVKSAIAAIKAANPEFIALSPHDSSDWSIAQFREAFKERYHDLKVGRELQLQ